MNEGKSEASNVHLLFGSLPADRAKRWNALKTFFRNWFGEIKPEDGYDEPTVLAAEERLNLRLPTALREWYQIAGRREEVWSSQDRFVPPEELTVQGEKLVFYGENQGAVCWAIQLADLVDDDPPVWLSHPRSWIEESRTVSASALSHMLRCVKFAESTRYAANGSATNDALAAVARDFQKLDFPDLSWPLAPTLLYGGQDIVIETHGQEWIWIAARSVESFHAAVNLIARNGVEWEHLEEP